VNFLEESRKIQNQIKIGKIDNLLASLKKEEKQSLIDAMNDLEISSRVISKVLNNHGHNIGRAAVDKWRHENVPLFHTRSNHYVGTVE